MKYKRERRNASYDVWGGNKAPITAGEHKVNEKMIFGSMPLLHKQTWKNAWKENGRIEIAGVEIELPTATERLETFSRTHRPSDSASPPSFEAKVPPYFAQAAPRGKFPHLNLPATLRVDVEDDGKGRKQKQSNATALTNRQDSRANRSLDSLFDLVRQNHYKSVNHGWCTERSHAMARERRRDGSRFAPDRPPSVSKLGCSLTLPGIGQRYNQRKRTPVEERSAGMRPEIVFALYTCACVCIYIRAGVVLYVWE
jgi:hypothetical protein